jgi:hypothetical protein
MIMLKKIEFKFHQITFFLLFGSRLLFRSKKINFLLNFKILSKQKYQNFHSKKTSSTNLIKI